MIRAVHNDPRYFVLAISLITISGIAGYVTRPKLEDPQSSVRRGQITTFLEGASPTEVESLITEPIEMALREAKGIRSVQSSSERGVSIVFVRLTDEVRDTQASWAKLQDKLSEVSSSLPPRASKPTLVDERRWDAYTSVVALVSRRSKTDPSVLARWAKELENRLRFIDGTRFTERFGTPIEEVLVELDERAIASTGLTPQDVLSKLKQRDSLTPDTVAQTTQSTIPVKLIGDIDRLDDLRNTMLIDDEDGTLRLRDIATIRRDEQKPQRCLAIVDDRRAVVIGTRMDTDYAIDRWTSRHLAALRSFESELPSDLELQILFSQKKYTDQRSNILYSSLGLGMLLVIGIVWGVMGWRSAIPICIAIPLSLLAVMFLMIPFGISLHQTSIAGLILALGMLIDNPIIVVDHMRRLRDTGVSAVDSITRTVRHLAIPLIGSNFTTILAFTPILLIPGTTGEYLGQLGWAVIACLVTSLLLSFSVVPLVASWTLRPALSVSSEAPHKRVYRACLAWMMRHRISTVAISSLLPMLGFAMAGGLKEQFFPRAERDHFHFSIRLPTQATLQESTRIARRARKIVQKNETVEDVSLFVGTNAPMLHYSMIPGDEHRPEFSQGLVTTKDQVTPKLIHEIQRELDQQIPEASCVVTLIEQGPPTIAPIEFRIYGPSLEELHRLGQEARQLLMSIPGVIRTRTTLNMGGPEMSLQVRQHDSTITKVTDDTLAEQLYEQLDGLKGVELQEETETIPVRVRLSKADEAGPERVLSLPIVTADRRILPIQSVANWKLGRQLFSISRRDSARCNIIQGTVAAGALPIEIEKAFRQLIDDRQWTLPAGYRMDFGGVSHERNSAVGNLLAYSAIVAVLIICALVLTLRSFRQAAIIGAVAILALGAGLLSLRIFAFPMGLMAIIGLLGMMGLAINDSITVLCDLKAGMTNGLMLEESTNISTQHVVTTSLTTAAGVTPLVLAGGEFWPPMMVVIAGGVIGATFLALGFTPAMYSLTCKGQRMNFNQWKRKSNVQSDEWIVITGSTSGIGHEFLDRICAAGCNVIAVSNEAKKLEHDKQGMESKYGVHVDCQYVDLSCENDVLSLGKELSSRKIVGLINNAGFGMKGDFLSHSAERYRDIIAVNSTAPMILQHAVLPQLRKRNQGLILNVASINAYVPIPNNQVYTATKSFLMSFALAVEAENDDTQITFQLLLPGTTRTPFHDKQGVDPPEASTMSVDQVVEYSLRNLNKSICIPNSRDRLIARIIGGPIPKKKLIRWVRREAERRLGMNNTQKVGQISCEISQ